MIYVDMTMTRLMRFNVWLHLINIEGEIDVMIKTKIQTAIRSLVFRLKLKVTGFEDLPIVYNTSA